MAALYRLSQGLRALFAFTQDVDEALAARTLTPSLLSCFQKLRRSEQIHSLRVLKALQDEGDVSPELAAAALLHDVGKSRYPMSLWQRSLPVLVKKVSPRLLKWLSSRQPEHWWSRGFVVYIHHPAWSAEIIRQNGAHPDTIWLAEHHADPIERWVGHPLFASLARLQHADDMN